MLLLIIVNQVTSKSKIVWISCSNQLFVFKRNMNKRWVPYRIKWFISKESHGFYIVQYSTFQYINVSYTPKTILLSVFFIFLKLATFEFDSYVPLSATKITWLWQLNKFINNLITRKGLNCQFVDACSINDKFIIASFY